MGINEPAEKAAQDIQKVNAEIREREDKGKRVWEVMREYCRHRKIYEHQGKYHCGMQHGACTYKNCTLIKEIR